MNIPIPKWIQRIRLRNELRRQAFANWQTVGFSQESLFKDLLHWKTQDPQVLRWKSLELKAFRINLLGHQAAYLGTLVEHTTLECFLYFSEVNKVQRQMDGVVEALEGVISSLDAFITVRSSMQGEVNGSVLRS